MAFLLGATVGLFMQTGRTTPQGVLPLLALGKWTWRTPAGVVPVYKVLPLLVTVTALFALGVFLRLGGHVP